MTANEQHAARLEEIAVDEGDQREYFKRTNLPEDPFHRKNYDALRAGAAALRERREDIESTTCDMSPKTTSGTLEAPDAR